MSWFKVAVYGTLRKGGRNHHWLQAATYLGKGETCQPYALYFNYTPYVVPQPPVSPIKIELYALNQSQFDALDRLEGHPYRYRREELWIRLQTTRQEVKAWLYFYPVAQGRCLPSGDYLEAPSGKLDFLNPWPGYDFNQG